MLFLCTNILQFREFLQMFKETHGTAQLLDLSKIPSSKLAEEALSIVSHHSSCAVFLGYLEPGWMLDSTHQVILRRLFRKFPVAMVAKYVDSIPFSWKNETHSIYTSLPLNSNGDPKAVDHGRALHDEP
jgi:hypothetical protein